MLFLDLIRLLIPAKIYFMIFEGNISKMQVSLKDVVQYQLPLGEQKIYMNDLIGSKITMFFHSRINCVKCGRVTNKSFNQGFCYPCFQSAPEADPAIIKPELDQAHEGISRDIEWAKENSLVDHYVYLAVSSGLKVGVTRYRQVPTRWIDQGAWKAIKIARTPYRQLAGLIEVELKEHFADKTNWRAMLQNKIDRDVNLIDEKIAAINLLPDELQEYAIDDDEITEIKYPVERYPVKIKSLNFDKTPEISGKLSGIKGQYLIFEDDSVINLRKYGGYYISLNY
jgi:hypothetical protein